MTRFLTTICALALSTITFAIPARAFPKTYQGCLFYCNLNPTSLVKPCVAMCDRRYPTKNASVRRKGNPVAATGTRLHR
jgi:hypothetical protein